MRCRLRCRLIVLFMLLTLLSGCGIWQSKAAAEAAADRLYLELAIGTPDSYLDQYPPEFYQKTTRAAWQRIRQSIDQRLGDYVSHELIGWRVTGKGVSGMAVVLTYRVVYSKHEARERLTFIGGRSPRLVSHEVDSQALSAG